MGKEFTNESEIYYLIARFLSNGPFNQIGNELAKQLEESGSLPKRYDWTGEAHNSTYNEIVQKYSHIPSDCLMRICNQTRYLLDTHFKTSLTSVNTILGSGKYSIIQDIRKKTSQNNKIKKENINIINNLHKRLLDSSSSNKCKNNEIIQPETFKSSNIHKRILGHLSAVYCICFDRTGKYILTGADDGLIKIWNAFECRLIATLRGHEKEISDIDVNFENTLVVSGSCDKTIRIWNLKTIESISVLHAHTSMVTSVEFSPYCKNSNRWMASSGNDGIICFWSWNVNTLSFNTKPKKFIEKSRPGAQILCISFSTGGSFMAAGSNDHSIRVYFIDNDVPQKVCELESHTNIVDSIQYANNLPWILSGSKDGTARVWKYEQGQWTAMLIDASKSLTKPDANDELSALDLYKKTSVTMVTWNCDDSYVVTAQNNFLIKVWSSKNGRLIHELNGHTNEVFVLEAHPKDSRLLLSAGHDGFVILWNIQTGKLIKKFYNKIENEGHGCLFDTKWSPLYDMFASTDSHGYLTIFGFGSDDNYKKLPNEQFFHTDYRPLARDSNDYVVDEQTQQAPHLMPPPFLVNADGHPYPVDLQRLVPGRENLTDLELNPTVIVNENGRSEIIGDGLVEQNTNNNDETQQTRRRNLYKKNVIRQLEDVLLKTNEEYRLDRLENEIKYYYTELYKEQLVPKVNIERKPIGEEEEERTTTSKKKRGRKKAENRVIREHRAINRNHLLDTEDEEPEEDLIDIETSFASDEITGDEQLDVGDNEHHHDLYESNSLTNHHDEDSRGPQTRHSTRLLNGNSNSALIYHNNDNLNDFLESADTSDYSDWAEEDGRKTLRPPPTRQVRKERRGRKKLRIRDDEDEEVDVDTEMADESLKLTRRIRKARVIQDDEEDDEQPTVEPKKSTSSQDIKPTTSHETSLSPKKKRGRKTKEEIEKRIATHLNANECPAEFRPPEWITSTKPKKSPYVPQIGDEVVYFRQGHEIYAEAVKSRQAYELDEQSLPWNKQSIKIQEFCKVTGLKFEIKPPRLVCLKLSIIDQETGTLLPDKYFTLKYHDMNGVADFVILRQIYDKSMERVWKPKEKFRSWIDEKWWSGIVVSNEPFQTEYPESKFQCYNVTWDSGEEEKLSPWDLEVPSCSLKKGKSSSKLDDDVLQWSYEPDIDDWPSCGKDIECERILIGLEKIMELSVAEVFNIPVDLDAYPSYAVSIAYPIDLNTIKQRLENRYYRRINSIQWDVRLIETNACEFNEPDSEIVRKAKFITKLLMEFISDSNCTNPIPIYKRLSKDKVYAIENLKKNEKNQNISEEDEEDVDITNDTNNQNSARKSKKMSRRTYQKDINSWKDDCKRLLDTIMAHHDSVPFRQPVDNREFPDYLRIIDTPMDFSSIRVKLLNGEYYSLDQFDSDCKLVFANSKSYNTNKRSRIFGMTLRLSSLYDAKIKEIKSEFKSVMKYNVRMTSRYGRKIKLRSNGKISEPLAEISTFIGHDSDDARHGFDEDINDHSTRGVGIVHPSSSGYLTRSASNKKLATTQTSHHHEPTIKKSSSNLANRTLYSQNASDSEDNSHMSASNSRSTRIQTRSKRSNGPINNSSSTTSITAAATSFSGRINANINSSNDVSHNLNSNGGSNHEDSNQTLSDIENQNTSDFTVGGILKRTRLTRSNTTTANGKRDEASASSKTRSSKRSRKQFSYKENSSSDSEQNELDTSITKKSSLSNKVARKKRRVLSSDDDNFIDSNSNEASNDAYHDSNSNPSGQKLSRSGRPLRSVTQPNFL